MRVQAEKAESSQVLQPGSSSLQADRQWACVVRDANMGHQLAGGSSSWCPELESRATHRPEQADWSASPSLRGCTSPAAATPHA